MILRKSLPSILVSLSLYSVAMAQLPAAPPNPPPDDRYKADILLIVAHPDDDSLAAPYLAKAMYEEHKRVSVIYGTRGNAGGNAVGNEQAAALGAVREIEGRRALACMGIFDVWFLNSPDTPGQDVLHSLETWGHGASLAQIVRFVRLTRPEVILTWLPLYVAGENHGDHQAAIGEAGNLSREVPALVSQESSESLSGRCSPAVPSSVYDRSNAFGPIIFISHRSLALAPALETRQSPGRAASACSVVA